MATIHKGRPSTNQINNQYNHFRDNVPNKFISIHAISTKEQPADIFNKPLYHNTFHLLKEKVYPLINIDMDI